MIEIRNVSHWFGEHRVLKDINLRIFEQKVAIVGSNGSGKSTFARLLNGLLLPQNGSVTVDGIDTRQNTKLVRQKVGFVFQNPENQIVLPIVEEDLAFGLKNLRLNQVEIDHRIDAILKRYNLEEYRQHPAHLLSGGQKQLLAISAVLIMQPEYIVFDEPTTLLDLRNRNKISQVVDNLQQSIIVVSHDLDLIRDFERVLVFNQGEVIIDDVPDIALPYYVRLMS